MKFAVLALLGLASVDAHRYHHHPYGHYQKHQSIVQEEPKADPKGETKDVKVNPDENRKTFEAAVKKAGMTVDTQQTFESKKTADVAKRNDDNIEKTFD